MHRARWVPEALGRTICKVHDFLDTMLYIWN